MGLHDPDKAGDYFYTRLLSILTFHVSLSINALYNYVIIGKLKVCIIHQSNRNIRNKFTCI